ncbi:ADP-ribosylation factor-like protein 8 [Nematocida sp. AWRm77]|nr:ADP-ribosylation factor-like protein 8 [Nematocida sp. AWRm77]
MDLSELFEKIQACIIYYFCSKKISICVAGVARSGKTSFCKAFITDDCTKVLKNEPPTTHMRIRKFIKENIHGIMYDIGGNKEYENLANFYYRYASAFFFVVDSSDPSQFPAAKEFLFSIITNNRDIRIPILILCTHNDIEESQMCQEIALEIGVDRLIGRDIACYSISSITGSNFNSVVEWVSKRAK